MCSPRTMVKIGVVLAVPLLAGFIFLPQFRVAILGLTPFALFALCPLSIIFCMKGMMGNKKDELCKHDKKGNRSGVGKISFRHSS